MRLLELLVTWVRDALARRSGTGRPPAPLPLTFSPRPPSPAAAGGAPARLVQPDRTTCGSACLVVARALGDPAYARWLASGVVPGRARDGRSPPRRFAEEVLATHVRTNRWSTPSGRRRPGWPLALGTTPWAVARELSTTGGTSPAGTSHRVLAVSPRQRERAYDTVHAAVELGHAVPLFVGSRLLPRHVVLAVGANEHALTAYDPATGRDVAVRRADFARGSLHVSGWSEPWFAVLPVGRTAGRAAD